MQLIFIKLGKVFNAIRKEGFWPTVDKSYRAVKLMFRKVGSGDVLFIAGGSGGASTLYRTAHVAEELKIHGFKTAISVQDNPMLPKYADRFSIFIFHRVVFTPTVKKLIENIKKQNKEIIFEADDLLFDPKYFEHVDYFKNINALEMKAYEKGLGSEILNDSYTKVATSPTTYLKNIFVSRGKKSFVVKNKLSNWDVRISEEILKTPEKREVGKIRIGYFSGTISHNKDFAVVTSVIERLMDKYPNLELFLAGPLDVNDSLYRFHERVSHVPYVDRAKYFRNISRVDINIAPLEMNPYCEAKSELKFFEPGIFGIPTVAVKNQTFSEAIEDGTNGFLASSESEWEEKLSRLIENENLRKTFGEAAKQKTYENYTNAKSHTEDYYEYLREHLKK